MNGVDGWSLQLSFVNYVMNGINLATNLRRSFDSAGFRLRTLTPVRENRANWGPDAPAPRPKTRNPRVLGTPLRSRPQDGSNYLSFVNANGWSEMTGSGLTVIFRVFIGVSQLFTP